MWGRALRGPARSGKRVSGAARRGFGFDGRGWIVVAMDEREASDGAGRYVATDGDARDTWDTLVRPVVAVAIAEWSMSCSP